MWYYYIIELIPDRCEQGKFLSVKIYGLEFVISFWKIVKTTVLGMRLLFGFSTKLKEKRLKKSPR